MYYAIMRCEKMKRNQCGQYDNHHWRQRDKLRERKNADKEDKNINWLKDNQTLAENIKQRIKKQEAETGKKIRKDTVTCIEFVFAYSPAADGSFSLKEWAKENLKWLENEVGGEVIEFNIEFDETTPHMHAVIAPIVDDRFNAKKICGKNFEKWQDSYAMYMSVFGLKRGISKKITKRKHTTLKEYNEQLKKENDILETEKSKYDERIIELIDERKHLADDILNDDFSEFYNNKGGHER